MKPGMEIVTSDGKTIGHIGPVTSNGMLQVARSPYSIPLRWVARIDEDVLLRRTYQQMVEAWGAAPGPVVIKGGKR